jgi:hypothetical protein
MAGGRDQGGRDGHVMERFDDVLRFGWRFLAQSLVAPADIEEGRYSEHDQEYTTHNASDNRADVIRFTGTHRSR